MGSNLLLKPSLISFCHVIQRAASGVSQLWFLVRAYLASRVDYNVNLEVRLGEPRSTNIFAREVGSRFPYR